MLTVLYLPTLHSYLCVGRVDGGEGKGANECVCDGCSFHVAPSVSRLVLILMLPSSRPRSCLVARRLNLPLPVRVFLSPLIHSSRRLLANV
jgi:hypothetical protein